MTRARQLAVFGALTVTCLGFVYLVLIFAVYPEGIGTNYSEPEIEASSRVGEKGIDKLDDDEWILQETYSTDGVLQIPPSIIENKKTIEEKVIEALTAEKQLLLKELTKYLERAAELEALITKLKVFRNRQNSTTALELEREHAMEQIRQMLRSIESARPLSESEKEIVLIASANSYVDLVDRSMYSMNDSQKELLIEKALTKFSLCLTHQLPYVVDNPAESAQLLTMIKRGDDQRSQETELIQDMNAISNECFSEMLTKANRIMGLNTAS